MEPLLKAVKMSKSYSGSKSEREDVHVLKEVEFTVFSGESCSIMGPSGSGKSTLLHILGCMDRPTAGQFFFLGQETSSLNDKALSAIRAKEIGFVFQSFNLIPHLTVYENVVLPFQYLPSTSIKEKAHEALEQVKLSHRLKHLPKELSGGEIQRTAIARALVKKPSIILADEPTGNLDSTNGNGIISLLEELNLSGVTILVITHDPIVAARFKTHYQIEDGKLYHANTSIAL